MSCHISNFQIYISHLLWHISFCLFLVFLSCSSLVWLWTRKSCWIAVDIIKWCIVMVEMCERPLSFWIFIPFGVCTFSNMLPIHLPQAHKTLFSNIACCIYTVLNESIYLYNMCLHKRTDLSNVQRIQHFLARCRAPPLKKSVTFIFPTYPSPFYSREHLKRIKAIKSTGMFRC